MDPTDRRALLPESFIGSFPTPQEIHNSMHPLPERPLSLVTDVGPIVVVVKEDRACHVGSTPVAVGMRAEDLDAAGIP